MASETNSVLFCALFPLTAHSNVSDTPPSTHRNVLTSPLWCYLAVIASSFAFSYEEALTDMCECLIAWDKESTYPDLQETSMGSIEPCPSGEMGSPSPFGLIAQPRLGSKDRVGESCADESSGFSTFGVQKSTSCIRNDGGTKGIKITLLHVTLYFMTLLGDEKNCLQPWPGCRPPF